MNQISISSSGVHNVGIKRPSSCPISANVRFAGAPSYVSSSNRESDTASAFQELVRYLGKHEKIIVVYQYIHSVPKLSACMPNMESETAWTTDDQDLNWISQAFVENPSLEEFSKIVLFDEVDPFYNKKGVTQLISRQSARRGVESTFGLNLRGFHGVPTSELGAKAFQAKSFLRKYLEGTVAGSSSLDEMVDAVIWSGDSNSNFYPEETVPTLPGIECTQ